MTSKESFTQLLERSLPADARSSSWCPTMDLLALSTADGQVAVQRLIWQPLSWQQLWSATPETPVTSLCWSPDGKVLAVGQSDGAVVLLNVENGELIHRQASHRASVVTMCWVAGHKTAPVDDRVPAFFNPPAGPQPIQALARTNIYSGISRADTLRRRWQPQPKQMSVLVSVDADGTVHVLAHGTFLLISFKLADVVPAAGTRQQGGSMSVSALALSRDLRQLAVLCSSEAGASVAEPGGVLRLVVLDTSILADRSSELQKLALQASQITRLLEDAKESLHECEMKWAAAMKQAGDKWALLRKLLADHASTSTPKKDFFTLLACGVPSAAMQHFLSATMGEPGTKRLAKVIDAAVVSVHELLLNNVVPALEIVIFRLGELHGLACCSDWIHPIELQEDALKSAEQFAMRLLIRAKQVMLQVTHAGALYRSFFLWMLHSLLLLNYDKMAQDLAVLSKSSEEVLEFLETQFEKDAIEAELACMENSTAYPDLESCADGCLLNGTGGVTELQRIFFGELPGSAPAMRLGNGLGKLSQLCMAIFTSLPPLLAESVQTLALVRLAQTPPTVTPEKRALVSCIQPGEEGRGGDIDVIVAVNPADGCSDESATCYLTTASVRACTHHSGTSFGWACLGMNGNCGKPQASIRSVAFRAPEGRVLDAGFYKEGQAALLTHAGDAEPPGGSHRLCVLNYQALAEAPVEVPCQEIPRLPDGSLVSQHALKGAARELAEDDIKSRSLGLCDEEISHPLAVSGPRGVACVLSGGQRVVLFDLEEEEEEEEEDHEEEDENEEDGDTAGGASV